MKAAAVDALVSFTAFEMTSEGAETVTDGDVLEGGDLPLSSFHNQCAHDQKLSRDALSAWV